jgi:hypothetical protein
MDVSLLWNEQRNRVSVRSTTRASIRRSELEVDRRSALDAYRHPFAYAAAHAGNRELANDTLAA